MKNGLFTIDLYSFIKGLSVAVITAVILTIYKVGQEAGFDVFQADWSTILHQTVNVGFGAGIGYIVTNFFSTDRGSVLGITPEAKPPVSD